MEKKVYCFGYSRKSPDDRKNTDISIKNQNDLITLICNKNNWELMSIEEDRDVSGSKENRKALSQQINNAINFKKNNDDTEVYLIVKDSKRFARNSAYSKKILDLLELNGVKVFSISKNAFIDYADIGDRLIGVVDEQIIFDAKKYAKITQELKESKNLPCIPAPFGYDYKDGNWIINKKQAKIVSNVVKMYIKNIDYKTIVKQNSINKAKYYRIIKNAQKGLYSGYITYDKKYKNSNGEIVKSEEVKYKGTHKKIISEEIYSQLIN